MKSGKRDTRVDRRVVERERGERERREREGRGYQRSWMLFLLAIAELQASK